MSCTVRSHTTAQAHAHTATAMPHTTEPAAAPAHIPAPTIAAIHTDKSDSSVVINPRASTTPTASRMSAASARLPSRARVTGRVQPTPLRSSQATRDDPTSPSPTREAVRRRARPATDALAAAPHPNAASTPTPPSTTCASIAPPPLSRQRRCPPPRRSRPEGPPSVPHAQPAPA